jgi:ElaB/YqjD/DUF883 family membrane-anchored ribosome-binding protein
MDIDDGCHYIEIPLLLGRYGEGLYRRSSEDATKDMIIMANPPKTTAAKTAAKAKPALKKVAAATTSKPVTQKAAPKKAAANGAHPETLRDQAKSLVGQASDKARGAANTSKEKATGMLDELSKMVDDVAKTIDERVGANYGDMARKAASTVSSVAGSLKSKDVDDLVADARKFVREKPAVAIGAAAAVGFLLTRLMKAGGDDEA